jgi:hypothetical protein
MAEIKVANLPGYENPEPRLPDVEQSEIQRKQLAMQEGLHKYKMQALKTAKEQTDIGLRSQQWMADNMPLLYQATADATDVDSQYFNDPAKMAKLMTDYKNKVGGNYEVFGEFVAQGKANESKVNARSLMIMREDYDSERDYKRALNNKLKGMDPAMRNKLFSQVDDETYMALANIYDTDKDYTWRDSLPDALDDILPESDAIVAGGVVTAGASLWGVAKLIKRGRMKDANKALNKITSKVNNKGLAWQSKNPNKFASYKKHQQELRRQFYEHNGGKNKETEKLAKKLFPYDNQQSYINWRDKKFGQKGDVTKEKIKNRKRGPQMQQNADGTWSKVPKTPKGGTQNVPATTPDPKVHTRTDVPGGRTKAEQIKYEWMKKKGRLLPTSQVGPYTGGGRPYGGTGGRGGGGSSVKTPGGQTVHGVKPQGRKKLNPKQIQDAEFDSNKVIPKEKIPFQMKNIQYLEKTGQMSHQEANIMRDAIKKLQNEGGEITQKRLLDKVMVNPNGKGIVEKVASGAIDPKKMFFGAGVASAMLGGYLGGGIGGTIGSAFGEKGEAIGDLVGTTAGAVGMMPAMQVITQKIKEQGMKKVMAKVTTRLGAKTAMKLIGAGVFSGVTSGPTLGLSNLITAGFVLSDIYAIYDILTEEE